MFIGLLNRIANACNLTNCVPLNGQQCMSQHTLIHLYPNNYGQGLCYYPFVVNLDKCIRSCNTLDDMSNKVYVPNKT